MMEHGSGIKETASWEPEPAAFNTPALGGKESIPGMQWILWLASS